MTLSRGWGVSSLNWGVYTPLGGCKISLAHTRSRMFHDLNQ